MRLNKFKHDYGSIWGRCIYVWNRDEKHGIQADIKMAPKSRIIELSRCFLASPYPNQPQ
jgi:hypothetical protein